MSTVRERVTAALKQGDLPAAQAVLDGAVVEAEAKHGKSSLEYAMALSDVAGLALQTRNVERAEELLRQALEARGAAKGPESPEYALGQAALAEVLAARGQLEQAEQLVEAAEQRLSTARHHDWPAVVALRGVLRFARQGEDVALFEPFTKMNRAERLQLVRICLNRTAVDAPKASLALLVELRERIEDGDDPDWDEGLLPVLEAVAQLAGAMRDHAMRADALDELILRVDAAGDARAALELTLARAATAEAAGDREAGEAGLADADRRAATLDDAARSHVLRARGVTADARGDAESAAKLLRESIEVAERAGHPMILALARAALGIFEQHAGRPDAAKPLLEQAIAGLPAGHPDQRMVGIHIDALSRGADCGCRDGRFALARRIEALAAPMLPQNLVRSVHVIDAASMKLDVVLVRPPTDAEGQQIQRALEQAVQRLRPQQPRPQ